MTERQSLGWSHSQGVDYEIARDVHLQLIAIGGRRIKAETQNPAPRAEVIASWRERCQEWTLRYQELSPTDSLALRRVLDGDAALLRELTNTGQND